MDQQAGRPLRIGLIAPPFLPIPPAAYAGTERIVAALAHGLHERGHSVTLFASGDSDVPCRMVQVVPRAIWALGHDDPAPSLELTLAAAWEHATLAWYASSAI